LRDEGAGRCRSDNSAHIFRRNFNGGRRDVDFALYWQCVVNVIFHTNHIVIMAVGQSEGGASFCDATREHLRINIWEPLDGGEASTL